VQPVRSGVGFGQGKFTNVREVTMSECNMYDAVEENNIEELRAYYQEHPDMLDAGDDGDYTILMEAAKLGRLEIVQCLVEMGANIDAYCEMIDHYSDARGTALAFALENGHRDVAIYLIQKGADTETAYSYYEEESPYSTSSVRCTCFMYAMDKDDTEMLGLMLQHGLDINGLNAYLPEESTPLFYAISEAKTDMVKWLIEHGADPLLLVKTNEMGTLSALQFAVYLGLTKRYKAEERFEIAGLLLKAGVDLSVTFKDCDFETLPDLVLEYGDERYIRLFGLQYIQERLNEAEAEPEEEPVTPEVFEIVIDGHDDFGFSIRWEHGALSCQQYLPDKTLGKLVTLTPPPEAWRYFWRVCNRAGIWEWRDSYNGVTSLEGTDWHIKIAFGGDYIQSCGDNAYPMDEDYPECEGYTLPFRKFLRGLFDLTHGLPFEMPRCLERGMRQ